MGISKRNLIAMAGAAAIFGACRSPTSQVAMSEVTSGPDYERAQKVFARLVASRQVFQAQSVRLRVFEGIDLGVGISNEVVTVFSAALAQWQESAQLAALFVQAVIADRTSRQEIIPTSNQLDQNAATVLVFTGFDPRALIDVLASQQGAMPPQRLADLNAIFAEMGYRI